MDHFALLTPHEQLVEAVYKLKFSRTFHQGFTELSVDH